MMLLSILAVVGGLVALAWSSDVFVDGAAALSRRFGVSPFIVGMVVIGFGTSAPELCVSVSSGIGGYSELSLGNAYGSCIFNIAAILGCVALVKPIAVKPVAAFAGAPILTSIALLSAFFLRGGAISRPEAFILLGLFAVLMPAYCVIDQKYSDVPPPHMSAKGEDEEEMPFGKAVMKTVGGLVVLALSSHALVKGSVYIATSIGVSQLVIGLTIVAIGTSLPELASAIAAARKNESDLVLGNIVGSNIFNTLAVVGTSASISPADNVSTLVATRDLAFTAALSASVFVFGLCRRKGSKQGFIGFWGGVALLATFAVYSFLLAKGR